MLNKKTIIIQETEQLELPVLLAKRCKLFSNICTLPYISDFGFS